MKKVLKVIGIILLILLILIIAALAGAYIFINQKFEKMQKVEIDKSDLSISEEVEEHLEEYRNIAIFGIDSWGSYETGDRSDCIMIASLNETTGEIKLISVYRDTYVNIEGHGFDKINHAYQFGSAQLALKTLNENLDLNIKEFVTVNFEAVVEAIDLLGKVEIEIDKDELKYINGYIDNVSKITGKKANKITKTGKQKLNGVQAVAYSRIRYTEGWDYKRTERMREVVTAMLGNLKNKSVGEINSFIDKLLPMVYTNITTNDMIPLIPNVAKYNISTSIGWPYRTEGIIFDNYYGIPITLESNVVQLHKEAFGEENYVVSDRVKTISEQIVEKSGYTE